MNLYRHIKVAQLIGLLLLVLFLVACLKIFAFPDHKAAAQNGTGSQPVFFTNATPAGTNLMGGVSIDQTTPGVTNGVRVLSGSTTAVTNGGTFSVQETASLPAGTNLIGNFGIDQTTPGSTNGVQVLAGSTTAVTNVAYTPVDASGTVATGGTFQTVFSLNAARVNCQIENPTTATEALYVHYTAATATLGNSISLNPGGLFNCAGNNVRITAAITVTAATTGHAFMAAGL